MAEDKSTSSKSLPFWEPHKRGMPNVMARACLFRVGSHKKKREYYENQVLTSQNGTRVIFTGYELRQDDADLFLQLIHLQRNSSFEHGVEFMTSPMLKSLNRSVNNVYRDKLRNSLSRMVANAITVETIDGNGSSRGYCGSLIQKFAWKDEDGNETRRWKIWFDPKIVALFDWASYSKIDWETRLKLGPLAKFMHLFYSSHEKPFAIKCETMKMISGSAMSQMKHFRQELKEAGEELKSSGFLESFSIDPSNDTIHVKRKLNQKLD